MSFRTVPWTLVRRVWAFKNFTVKVDTTAWGVLAYTYFVQFEVVSSDVLRHRTYCRKYLFREFFLIKKKKTTENFEPLVPRIMKRRIAIGLLPHFCEPHQNQVFWQDGISCQLSNATRLPCKQRFTIERKPPRWLWLTLVNSLRRYFSLNSLLDRGELPSTSNCCCSLGNVTLRYSCHVSISVEIGEFGDLVRVGVHVQDPARCLVDLVCQSN